MPLVIVHRLIMAPATATLNIVCYPLLAPREISTSLKQQVSS